MGHGLNDDHLVLLWRWRPVPPSPLTTPLAGTAERDDSVFRAEAVPPGESEAFRFSFPQLSRQTPDLHFYRLLQLFNTPLLSLDTREAGRSNYALWRGRVPEIPRGTSRWAHLWFFLDERDGDSVVLEYAFDGGFVLRSTTKDRDARRARYAAICGQVCGGRPSGDGTGNRVRTPPISG